MECLTVEAGMMGMDDIRGFMRDQMKGIHDMDAHENKLYVELAVEEIFFAIVGNSKGEEGKVEICMEVNRQTQQLMITIAKSGLPFNPLRYRQPDCGLKEVPGETGGLGFRILEYIDRLRYEYRAGKNVIIISKRW